MPKPKRGQLWEVDFEPQTHKEEPGKLPKAKDETDLLVDQIRTIAHQHFMGEKPLAELSRAHMKRVEEALKLLTGP